MRLYISGRTEELNRLERVMRSPDMLLAFFCKSPIMVVPDKRSHGSSLGSSSRVVGNNAKEATGTPHSGATTREVELVHVVLYNDDGKESSGGESQKRVLLQITPRQKSVPSGSGIDAAKENKDGAEVEHGVDGGDATTSAATTLGAATSIAEVGKMITNDLSTLRCFGVHLLSEKSRAESEL